MLFPTCRDVQIAGLWVDSDGTMKSQAESKRRVCRWSLRKTDMDFKNPWKPDAHSVVLDGDSVMLHCHSYCAGSFRDVDSSMLPYYAPNVHTNPDGSAKVVRSEGTALNIRDYQLPTPLWYMDENNPDIGDISFLFPESNIQSIMERFDQGQESDAEGRQLSVQRDFYGVGDYNETGAVLKFTSSYRELTRSGRSLEDLTNFVRDAIPAAVKQSWNKWDSDNGGFAPQRFIVKFVQ